jgi:CRP-like cAMP-binding protein
MTGAVEIFQSDDVIEGVLGPGDYFGAEHLLGLTSDPISARALSKVYLAVVPKEIFFNDNVFLAAREVIAEEIHDEKKRMHFHYRKKACKTDSWQAKRARAWVGDDDYDESAWGAHLRSSITSHTSTEEPTSSRRRYSGSSTVDHSSAPAVPLCGAVLFNIWS